MVNRDLIEVFSEIAREKNVDRSELATILEELFLYIIERNTETLQIVVVLWTRTR